MFLSILIQKTRDWQKQSTTCIRLHLLFTPSKPLNTSTHCYSPYLLLFEWSSKESRDSRCFLIPSSQTNNNEYETTIAYEVEEGNPPQLLLMLFSCKSPPIATEIPAVVKATVRFLCLLSSSEMGMHSSLLLIPLTHNNGFTPTWNNTFFKSSLCSCDAIDSSTFHIPGEGREYLLQCCITRWSTSLSFPSLSTPTKNMPFLCSCDYASATSFILTWMLQQYAKDSGQLPSNSSTTLHPSPPHQPHRSHASTHCQSPSLFSSLTSVHYPSPPPFFPTIKNFKSWGSHLSSCGTTHSVVSMGPSISLAPFTPFPLFK